MFSGEDIAPGLFAWAIPNGETHRIGVWAHPDRLGGRSCEMLYDTLRNHPLWKHRSNNTREQKNTQRIRTQRFFSSTCKTKIGHQSGRQGADSGHTLCPKSYVFGLHFGPVPGAGEAQKVPKIAPRNFPKTFGKSSFYWFCDSSPSPRPEARKEQQNIIHLW